MRLAELDFVLPQELIAQTPAEPRDSARLLVYRRDHDQILHAHVRDLPDLLPEQALLVANNSKVRRSRLYGKSATGKAVEILLLERLEGTSYRCLLGGSRGLEKGMTLPLYADHRLGEALGLTAAIRGRESHPAMTTFILELAGKNPHGTVEESAQVPLPPYIAPGRSRPDQYQTIYAKELGSAAAPTAGLHFTPELLGRLRDSGREWAEVTLHVGLGTFLPLRQERVEDNVLHTEETFVSPQAAAQVNAAKQTGRPVVAIGTTSCRTLEAHWQDGQLETGASRTQLFIYPGYRFQAVDGLLTNFHLPKSSLLLLVAALLGDSSTETAVVRLRRLYAAAIAERYRFYSFGDAMLIL